jgi:hypothetical protein
MGLMPLPVNYPKPIQVGDRVMQPVPVGPRRESNVNIPNSYQYPDTRPKLVPPQVFTPKIGLNLKT